MADFTFFSLSLLPTENLQNHFLLEFLVFNFAFRTNFASKKRTAPQGWMLVTSRKPERKKGRKKNRYVCMENQKKKKIVNVRCWSLILPSWDIFWPLLKWTLRAQCCCFCCKKRWIAIVEQPDSEIARLFTNCRVSKLYNIFNSML
jgi:hypothetical protein